MKDLLLVLSNLKIQYELDVIALENAIVANNGDGFRPERQGQIAYSKNLILQIEIALELLKIA